MPSPIRRARKQRSTSASSAPSSMGESTELLMFVMRRSHSGRAVHVCFPSEGQEAFLEGHAIAFERFGRAPGRVRYDNLKAAAVRGLAGRDRVESDRFTAPRSHFGFDAF
ncbi:MAG: hypothetical protein OXN86_04690, partial [Chloroflexota bacterium]|nr:hypothetical protein [Chloroflexota bacterium]